MQLAVTGTYSIKLDEKGRISIPKTARQYFEKGLYLTRGPDHTLYLLPLETYEKRRVEVDGLGNFEFEDRKQKQLFYGGFFIEKLDSMGRFLITDDFRKYASLDKETVIVGIGDAFQLWDNDSWENYWNISEQSFSPKNRDQ